MDTMYDITGFISAFFFFFFWWVGGKCLSVAEYIGGGLSARRLQNGELG